MAKRILKSKIERGETPEQAMLHLSKLLLLHLPLIMQQQIAETVGAVAEKRAAMKKDMRRIAASKRETRRLLDEMKA